METILREGRGEGRSARHPGGSRPQQNGRTEPRSRRRRAERSERSPDRRPAIRRASPPAGSRTRPSRSAADGPASASRAVGRRDASSGRNNAVTRTIPGTTAAIRDQVRRRSDRSLASPTALIRNRPMVDGPKSAPARKRRRHRLDRARRRGPALATDQMEQLPLGMGWMQRARRERASDVQPWGV